MVPSEKLTETLEKAYAILKSDVLYCSDIADLSGYIDTAKELIEKECKSEEEKEIILRNLEEFSMQSNEDPLSWEYIF